MNYKSLNEKIADALVEDGYVVIEDALEETLVEKLLEEITQETSFQQATISHNLILDTKKRKDKISWLDEKNPIERDFLTFTSSLQEYLNATLYLGLRYYEAHFAIYNKGDFYERHLDSFKHTKNRIVTTVFYLNECKGGELVIYNDDGNIVKKLQPKKNTLVVFLSEKFPHEVLPAGSKRYSIAGWFRIDKI